MKTNLRILLVILAVCAVLGIHTVTQALEEKPALLAELVPEDYDSESVEITEELQLQTVEVLQKRFGERASVVPIGLNQLRIEVLDDVQLAAAEEFLKKQGRLEFREPRSDTELLETEWVTRMDGRAIRSAKAVIDEYSSGWMVSFQLTDTGTEQFANLTEELIGKPLGIFFDNEKISAPVVQTAITGGEGQINGNFTKEEAQKLANYMNSGFLPVKLKILSVIPAQEAD